MDRIAASFCKRTRVLLLYCVLFVASNLFTAVTILHYTTYIYPYRDVLYPGTVSIAYKLVSRAYPMKFNIGTRLACETYSLPHISLLVQRS